MIIKNPEKSLDKIIKELKKEFDYGTQISLGYLESLIEKLQNIKDGYEYIIWDKTK